MGLEEFFGQVLAYIGEFGGLPFVGKVAGIILLLIGTLKVSVFRPVWDMLGSYKVFVAPVLGLAAGLLSLAGGEGFNVAQVLAYVVSGAGAILLHELLDGVKALPGLGPLFQTVVTFLQGLLKRPK